ncbi:MAG: hypothetical protein ACFFG0_25725, partial [Candidatus Thorarchaeota archaeon]
MWNPVKNSNFSIDFGMVDISIFFIVVTHPISPLLSLPGLFAATFTINKHNYRSAFNSLNLLLLLVVGYLTWTLYM